MNIFRLRYTLRTFSQQATVQGYATVTTHKDKRVMLDVQPVEASELKYLPEGCRSSKNIKAYGDFPVTTADTETGRRADLLFYDGDWYECVASHFREHTPLRHYKSYFTRTSEAGDAEDEPEETESDDD